MDPFLRIYYQPEESRITSYLDQLETELKELEAEYPESEDEEE